MDKAREFNALHLVESLADEFAAKARANALQISGYAMPEAPQLYALDENICRAVLRILMAWSINHTANGAVMVELLEDPDAHKTVRFCVSDSRTDVLPQDLDTALELLNMQPVNGTTLGGALESMGTKLAYDKAVLGRTTRFYFNVPKTAAQFCPPDIPLSEKLMKTRFFLVANDPPPNRIIQQYVRFYGVYEQGAPTAAESLSVLAKVAEENPFEIIGVAPPIEDMSAFELAKAIRTSKMGTPKLLYVAPFDDPEDRLAAMEAGFDMTIAKPIVKSHLFATLEQLAGNIVDAKTDPVRQLILIAEDNPVNQKLALFQVRALGFEGVLASDGVEAVRAAESVKFAAILMDVNMPEMDGIEATKAIRAGSGLSKDAPIIGLTAYPGFQEQAIEAGMDYFLEKPANKQQITTALTSCGVVVAQNGARKRSS